MTTTTPDERDLRRAVNADPANAHARLILAEAIQEQGREREAAIERIAAEPWSDVWRLQLADVCERTGCPARARFIRCQVELGQFSADDWEARYNAGTIESDLTHPVGRRMSRGFGLTEEMLDRLQVYNEKIDTLRSRERSLLLAHEADFRRGPTCERCEGDGNPNKWDHKPGGSTRMSAVCPDCQGTGDGGGLMQTSRPGSARAKSPWGHAVTFRRGCPERVECRIADVIEEFRERCEDPAHFDNPKRPGWKNRRHCVRCNGSGSACSWRVTNWAKQVVRWHGVLEFGVTDREPYHNAGNVWVWIASPSSDRMTSALIPGTVYAELKGDLDPLNGFARAYPTADAANLALATALARTVRAALGEE